MSAECGGVDPARATQRRAEAVRWGVREGGHVGALRFAWDHARLSRREAAARGQVHVGRRDVAWGSHHVVGGHEKQRGAAPWPQLQGRETGLLSRDLGDIDTVSIHSARACAPRHEGGMVCAAPAPSLQRTGCVGTHACRCRHTASVRARASAKSGTHVSRLGYLVCRGVVAVEIG